MAWEAIMWFYCRLLLECLRSSKGVLVAAFWWACLFNRLSVYYLPILPLSTFVLICPYQFLPWQYVEAIKKYGSRFKKFLSLKILGSPNGFYLYCQVFQISLIWNLKNVCEAFLVNLWESGDLCSLQPSPQAFQDVWEWFQPHWTSCGESRILGPIQNSADLTVFRISRLAGLQCFHWILSCKRVWKWHLIKGTIPFMYLDVGGIDCWTLLSWPLVKTYPSLK